MRSVHSVKCFIIFALVLTSAWSVSAQTAEQSAQPRLEVLSHQGDYYWVVETAPDGSRKGGWVSAQVPLDRIDRNALKPIAALPPLPNAPQGSSDAAGVNERLARIEQALTAAPSAGSRGAATPPSTSVQFVPPPQIAQATPQTPTNAGPHPQTREGFWFNGGLGFGSAGCQNCLGRVGGGSGGLSLGGTVSKRVLLGVGTSGWYRSVDGATVTGGTLDGRVRVYPVVKSGFFLTGGLGLGHISVSLAGVGGATEYGVGALFGLGWDIRVSRNVSLTPFYNGFAVQTANADGNVDQIGLGVTLH